MSDTFIPGLAGIPAAKSQISFIDGRKGVLAYRGIRIEELAEHSHFEEVVYLLFYGELPTEAQLAEFVADLRELRSVPKAAIDMLRQLPADAHPMVALQAAVAAMGAYFPALDVTDREGNQKAARRLVASMPTLMAAFDRIRQGKEVIEPSNELGHAANFLYMLSGERPNEQVAHLLDVCLTLHAEHGFNASTFTARVIASTLANPFSVIAGAIGSLSGPLHGGANEKVLTMLEGIGSVEAVVPFFNDMAERRAKIMGLGHRVYKVKDPRADVLQDLAKAVFASHGSTPLYDIATRLEDVATEHWGAKGIYPNVDFYSGLVYEKMGMKVDLFTPVFAISRVSGWMAHWLEQIADNRIFRPTQIYEGRHEISYVPMDAR